MKTLLIFLFTVLSFVSFSQPQEYSSDEGPWNLKIEFLSSGQVMYKAKGRQSFYNIKNKSYDTVVTAKNEKVMVLIDEVSHQDYIVIDENDVAALQRQVSNFKKETNSIKFVYTGYKWKNGAIIQEYDMNFVYTSDMSKSPCRYFYDESENVTILVEYVPVD